MDPLAGLAEAAQAGDRSAAGQLLDALHDPVWRVCAGMVDRRSADDLAQEALLRVWRSLDNYRGESSVRTWALSIAGHTCIDELRRRTAGRRRDTAVSGRLRSSSAIVADSAEQVALEDLIRGLEPERRLAFVLTQLVGLRYEDAAKICGCPVGTIRSRVARARSELIDALRGHP